MKLQQTWLKLCCVHFNALSNSIKPIFAALSTKSWLTIAIQLWLERAAKFIVWVIGIAVILDIFGIQIGPLGTGLGLFSVAVALGRKISSKI